MNNIILLISANQIVKCQDCCAPRWHFLPFTFLPRDAL